MILSGESIQRLGILTPCYPKYKRGGVSGGLSYCGYDLSLRDPVLIPAGKFALASAFERFTMPDNVVGFIHDKSTWARTGIMVQNTVVEPGWEGWLTIELTNHGDTFVNIDANMPIAQVVFAYLDQSVEGYTGKYQGQGPRPQVALFE